MCNQTGKPRIVVRIQRGFRMKSILVLDDEFKLLTLVCRLLQRHGYKALEARNADEALRLFYDHHDEIDLFIVDICLPASSGIQVAIDLRSELPDLVVLLVSGYPQNAWSPRDSALFQALGPHFVSILQKPFTPQTLIDRVDELIGSAPPKWQGTNERRPLLSGNVVREIQLQDHAVALKLSGQWGERVGGADGGDGCLVQGVRAGLKGPGHLADVAALRDGK